MQRAYCHAAREAKSAVRRVNFVRWRICAKIMTMARIRFEDVPHDKAAEKDKGGRAASRQKEPDLADPQRGGVDDENSAAGDDVGIGDVIESANPGASGKKKRTKRAKPA